MGRAQVTSYQGNLYYEGKPLRKKKWTLREVRKVEGEMEKNCFEESSRVFETCLPCLGDI